MSKKVRSQRNLLVGDVVEIVTKRGFAYAQCIRKVEVFGPLLRVFAKPRKTKVTRFADLVDSQESYLTFVDWNKDVDRRLMHIIGRASVPERCTEMPLFKDGVADPKTGRVAIWWLWDGKKEWRVGKLTKEQKELPMRWIMNFVCLIDRIEEGWHPRDEAR